MTDLQLNRSSILNLRSDIYSNHLISATVRSYQKQWITSWTSPQRKNSINTYYCARFVSRPISTHLRICFLSSWTLPVLLSFWCIFRADFPFHSVLYLVCFHNNALTFLVNYDDDAPKRNSSTNNGRVDDVFPIVRIPEISSEYILNFLALDVWSRSISHL